MATTRQPITVAAHCVLGNPDEMFGSPHHVFIDAHGDVLNLGFYTQRDLRVWLRELVRQGRLCRRAAAVALVAYRGAMSAERMPLRYAETLGFTPAGCWPEELPAAEWIAGKRARTPAAGFDNPWWWAIGTSLAWMTLAAMWVW